MPERGAIDSEAAGGRTGWGSRSDVVGLIVALVVGLLSLVIGVGSIVYSWKNDQSVERRLDVQDERQFAIYIDLGAVPSDVYSSDEFVEQFGEKEDDEYWWAVINPSPVAIRGVWVEGPDHEFVRIGEIQRCTLYVLHVGPEPLEEFEPSSVHFKDPKRADWSLSADGELEHQPYDYPSDGNDDGNAQDMPMGNCV